MKRRSRRGGFTLLEVLFAATIVALVMGILYSSLMIVMRSRESSNAAIAPVKSALQAADLIRQDLEAVLPPDLADNGKLSGEFIGNAQGQQSLDFYCLGNDAGWALAPPAAALPGRAAPVVYDEPWTEGSRHVQIRLDTDGKTLIRGVTRNLLSPAVLDPEPEILCRNVKTFTVKFYDGTDWQTQWDSTQLGNTLPAAVMMTMEVLVDSRPGQEPELYKVTRVFPLACAKPLATTGGTGGATGGTGGAAAGGAK